MWIDFGGWIAIEVARVIGVMAARIDRRTWRPSKRSQRQPWPHSATRGLWPCVSARADGGY